MTHLIRTTIEPGKELEVSDEEFLDLTRMGLVLPDSAPTPTPIKTKNKETL